MLQQVLDVHTLATVGPERLRRVLRAALGTAISADSQVVAAVVRVEDADASDAKAPSGVVNYCEEFGLCVCDAECKPTSQLWLVRVR